MSEVYIRSQNKEKLYRLGGNYACVEYGEYEDVKKKRGGAEADKKRHVICISDGCLEEIGEYATKERCLEVLDEIQKACVNVALKHNMETRKFRPIKIEQRAHIDGFVSVIDAMTVRQKYWEECGELLKNAA